jgi:hypothetical protein
MGFRRKATFVAPGGAAGPAVNASSKEEDIANAPEKQTRQARVPFFGPRPTPTPGAAPPAPAFPLANYDGGCPFYPKTESSGTLTVKDGKWELRFPGPDHFFHGGLVRYPMTVTETGPKSCYVKMADKDDPTPTWSFELPETSMATLDAAVKAALPKPPPEVPPHAAGDPQSQVAAIPAPRATAPPIGVADEIAKLGKLKESGLLTEDEFAAQKAKLLAT